MKKVPALKTGDYVEVTRAELDTIITPYAKKYSVNWEKYTNPKVHYSSGRDMVVYANGVLELCGSLYGVNKCRRKRTLNDFMRALHTPPVLSMQFGNDIIRVGNKTAVLPGYNTVSFEQIEELVKLVRRQRRRNNKRAL